LSEVCSGPICRLCYHSPGGLQCPEDCSHCRSSARCCLLRQCVAAPWLRRPPPTAVSPAALQKTAARNHPRRNNRGTAPAQNSRPLRLLRCEITSIRHHFTPLQSRPWPTVTFHQRTPQVLVSTAKINADNRPAASRACVFCSVSASIAAKSAVSVI
ncbi:MAG: hypothetical protein RLZZ536_2613, partial [Planctomycetota bacterium]